MDSSPKHIAVRYRQSTALIILLTKEGDQPEIGGFVLHRDIEPDVENMCRYIFAHVFYSQYIGSYSLYTHYDKNIILLLPPYALDSGKIGKVEQ